MSAAQAIASNRFLTAMGPMIADEQKMNEIMAYIEYIKLRSVHPQITMDELEANGMPLDQAMNQLREKANTK